jgi:predicted Zn-dependent protease
MADMQSRQQLQAPKANNLDDELVQAMMSARARVFAQPGVDALRAWANEAADTSIERLTAAKRMGVLYGAYLSWLQLRDFRQAKAMLPMLKKAAGGHAPALRLVQLLETELAFKEEDMRGAVNSLMNVANQASPSWPRPELLYFSQAVSRLQTTSPSSDTPALLAKAVLGLQRTVLQNPQDGQVWQVLAAALLAQGRPLASLRAEGEAQMARMDFGAAVDRFRAAQDASRKLPAQMGDHIEASIVDARLRVAQGLLKDQMMERQDR